MTSSLDRIGQHVAGVAWELYSSIRPLCDRIWYEIEPLLIPAWLTIQQRVAPLWRAAEPHVVRVLHVVDAQLRDYRPWQLVLYTFLITWSVLVVSRHISSLLPGSKKHGKGFLHPLFALLRKLPILKGMYERERRKIRQQFADKISSKDSAFYTLPKQGLSTKNVSELMKKRAGKDVAISDGRSTVTGTVYLAQEEHKKLLNAAYSQFYLTNPIHANTFPSVRLMEAEVVSMTASLLGGGVSGDEAVCGSMTSGGTESILSAMKVSRDYMREKRNINHPEIIIASSAHPAYHKAAEYFCLKLVTIPVGSDYRLSAGAVQRYITRNTVCVVASAPTYPHGVIDDIAGIAKVTKRAGVMLHVDACLGGFVLPFTRLLGYPVPAFDFRVPGVTSMSVDTHKFGMAHKGTSVVLYRNADIRKYQYVRVTDWSGGLYISPGMPGSRNGALIATAWAALLHQGLDGYMVLTSQIMQAAQLFVKGLKGVPELELVTEPDMCVVAFKSVDPKVDIYALNDELSRRGWSFSALQFPAALHFCFTAAHVQVVNDMLGDLVTAVHAVKGQQTRPSDGSAPLYGFASTTLDRGLVGELLVAFQDVLLEP